MYHTEAGKDGGSLSREGVDLTAQVSLSGKGDDSTYLRTQWEGGNPVLQAYIRALIHLASISQPRHLSKTHS